eukprot:1156402-Pelagomonas_calceolata.AAC.2
MDRGSVWARCAHAHPNKWTYAHIHTQDGWAHLPKTTLGGTTDRPKLHDGQASEDAGCIDPHRPALLSLALTTP